MLWGEVMGTVTSTVKSERLVGMKFLSCRIMAMEDDAPAKECVAVDTVGAGMGGHVLIVTGSAARVAVAKDAPEAPIDAAIVAIIDNGSSQDSD